MAVEDPLVEAFREVFEVLESVVGFALTEIENTDGGLGGGHLLKWAGIIDFAKLAENGVAFAGEVEDSQVVGGMGSDEECFPVGASGSGFGGAAADEGDDVVGAQGVSGGRVFRAQAPSRPEGSAGQDPQERFHAHLGERSPIKQSGAGLGSLNTVSCFLGGSVARVSGWGEG